MQTSKTFIYEAQPEVLVIVLVIVLAVVAAAGLIGWLIWRRSHKRG